MQVNCFAKSTRFFVSVEVGNNGRPGNSDVLACVRRNRIYGRKFTLLFPHIFLNISLFTYPVPGSRVGPSAPFFPERRPSASTRADSFEAFRSPDSRTLSFLPAFVRDRRARSVPPADCSRDPSRNRRRRHVLSSKNNRHATIGRPGFKQTKRSPFFCLISRTNRP